MSEISTFSARLDLDQSSESFASLYQRISGTATTAASSVKQWMDQTVADLSEHHQVDGMAMSELAAEPLALAPLCIALDVGQHASASDVSDALARHTSEAKGELLASAINEVRTAQRALIHDAVADSLVSLGYRVNRSGTAASTFAHADGTSARVEIKPAGASVGVNLDLGGFTDGRCRQVRAEIVDKLKRRGIALRLIVRDDVPMEAYNACVAGRKAGVRRLR